MSTPMACPQSPLHFPTTRTSPSPSALGFRRRALPAASPLRCPPSLLRAKFEKFGPSDEIPLSADPSPPPDPQPEPPTEDEDADLPTDLQDGVRQSAVAAAAFIASGGTRAIVELLIPQFLFLDEEGAQAEIWESSRIFLETLLHETGRSQRIKAIFPDTGSAAMLSFQWKDAGFGFSSLSDRRPVDKEDDIVVMVLPDYQMLEYVEKIASSLEGDLPRPLVMWNPRLVSEDVGVGFNVRRLRRYFLSTFTTVYSLRPLPTGAVFRCYPGLWKVFYDDKDRPNRYLLAKEQPGRPDASELDLIFGGASAGSDEEGPSLLGKIGSAFSSLGRFMNIISK